MTEENYTIHYRLVIEGSLIVGPDGVNKPQEVLDSAPDRDLFNHDPGPNGLIVKREVLGVEEGIA